MELVDFAGFANLVDSVDFVDSVVVRPYENLGQMQNRFGLALGAFLPFLVCLF